MKGKIVYAGLVLLIIIAFSLYIPYPKGQLSPKAQISLHILDRKGEELRELISDEGGQCSWVELDKISHYVEKATLAAEDRYFFLHPGINVFAMAMAGMKNIQKGRIVSGASTITQQLARNLYRRPRTIFSKVFETWIALRLERTLSKEEILAQYLNRVFYGNLTYGIEAAARLYFDKPSSDLSLAESAFLAAIPRSPRRFNPYNGFHLTKEKQSSILKRMHMLGCITRNEWARAEEEPLNISPPKKKFRAPHFCNYVLSQLPPSARSGLTTIRTTLDYSLQEKVEILVQNHIDGLKSKQITNAAVLVLDNHTADILCMVGSKNFFDDRHEGQVNGSLARRQPGSALKPFTYGLALERGLTAAHIIEDREIQYKTPGGTYRPQNYDKQYHGLVRMRTALACSYNIPAVVLLEKLGPELLYQRLQEAGFQSLEKSPGFYGVGLTLGNGEVTLLELTQAYSALARGGTFLRTKAILSGEPQNEMKSKRIFSPQITFILTHMLSDKDARIPAFGYHSPLSLPFPCAIKTGTSKDFRDNWTAGYTPDYTVGVWVGNFDGAAMLNISGITGCGPLFRDVMLLLEKEYPGKIFPEPDNLNRVKICLQSGKKATHSCPYPMEEIFVHGTEPFEFCTHDHTKDRDASQRGQSNQTSLGSQLRILFPMDGDIFKFDPILRRKFQSIRFKASIPDELNPCSIKWWLDGENIGTAQEPFYWILKPGTHSLSIRLLANEKWIQSKPISFTVLH
ncbi:penicillin-binding protein 1C [Acidobacteriota bacterium]